MKFDSNKVFSLINKRENSLSGFALKIGMSHTGLRAGLVKESLGVKKLIRIAEYFNKPIEYFFENNTEFDTIEDISSIYKMDPTSLNKNKCTNPECFDEKRILNKQKMELLEENRILHKEKIKWLEEQKGETNSGKKVKGDVEESEQTGTNG